MIDVMFQKSGENTLVRIDNQNLLFAKVSGGHLLWSNIDGLRFSVLGIIKEFPDLKDKPNEEVMEIGKQRFKEHINSLNSEEEIKDYIIKDLEKHGFNPLFTQRKGHRIKKWQ